jgi:hypothetical protein
MDQVIPDIAARIVTSMKKAFVVPIVSKIVLQASNQEIW